MRQKTAQQLPVASRPATVGALRRQPRLLTAYGMLTGILLLASPAMAAAGGQPFVIHETYEQATGKAENGAKASHGIVGLDLLIQKGRYPTVENVFRGTPAAIQGLLPGDQILAVNGVSTLNKNLGQVDTMISDVPGDRVMLTVQRGERLSQIRLTVAALEELPSQLRAEFSSIFGGTP